MHRRIQPMLRRLNRCYWLLLHLISSSADRCIVWFIFDVVCSIDTCIHAELCPNHLGCHFHYNLNILTAIWTILYMDWIPSMEPRNPTNFYKLEFSNPLVSFTVLSHNYKNYNYDLIGSYSLQHIYKPMHTEYLMFRRGRLSYQISRIIRQAYGLSTESIIIRKYEQLYWVGES
jgi:hypothetical protein